MWIDVLRFLGIYLSFLLLIFICGKFVLKLLKKTFTTSGYYTGLFLSLLLGLIVLVSVFSIIKTHFLTVCIFFPLALFLSFYGKNIWFQSRGSTPANNRTFTDYLILSLLILLPFFYFSLIVFKKGDFQFSALAYDNVLYAELSAFVSQSGIENRWSMLFSDLSFVKGVEPYHYVDSWLNALCLYVSKSNALLLFYLVTYPALITITLCGILAIIERFKKTSIVDLIISILLISMGPIYQVKMINYHFNVMACEIPLQHFGEKYSVFYPFILLSILLALNNYFKEAMIWLLSLAIVSSTTLPAILIFIFCYILISKEDKTRIAIKVMFFTLVYLLFFGLLSHGENSHGNMGNMLQFTDLSVTNFDITSLKLTISNFLYSLFSNLKYFVPGYLHAIPILLYFSFFEKSKESKFILQSLFFCLSGLIAAIFFYKLPDSKQLFTNTLPVLHCVLIVFIILLYYTNANSFIRIITLVFSGFFFINTLCCSLAEYSNLHAGSSVSDFYLARVEQAIKNDPKGQHIGYIYNQKDDSYLKFNPDSNYLYHLSYLGIDPKPLDISFMEINYDAYPLQVRKSAELKNNHELFYTFYAKHSVELKNVDTIKSQFIKNYHLNYLILGPTTPLPSFIAQMHPIVIRDPKTHICFIRLPNI